MHKHVFAAYSTTPGTLVPPDDAAVAAQGAMDETPVVESFEGPARVATYSVVHGRDGAPEWAALVCDLEAPSDGDHQPPAARCYARLTDPASLEAAESDELIGRRVKIAPDGTGGNAANL